MNNVITDKIPSVTNGKKDIWYNVYLPSNYKKENNHPVFGFFHGRDQAGPGTKESVNAIELGGTLPAIARAGDIKTTSGETFIVVAPQLVWGEDWNDAIVEAVLKIAASYGDPDRIVDTGLSLGGVAVMGFATRSVANAQRFSCLIPVCCVCAGVYEYAALQNITNSNVPCWFWVGKNDYMVDQGCTTGAFDAVKAGNPDTRLSYLEGVDHAVWIPAYRDQALIDWAASKRRIGAAAPVVSSTGGLGSVLKDDALKVTPDNVEVGLDTPKAVITGATTTTVGQSQAFDGRQSTGTIKKYKWSKVSGPDQYYLTSENDAVTYINNVVPGTYVFRLTVTNNAGLTSSADVKYTVTGTPAPKTLVSYNVTPVYSDGSKGAEVNVDKAKVQI